MLFKLAHKSLLNRKSSVLLTLVALIISTSLLFTVEHIRTQAKDSFKRTVAGVDLVVAGRSSQINVLLSSVFGLGGNANTVDWSTYQHWTNDQRVKWSIPLSLGDSHKGFAVIGTQNAYFEHYKYGRQQALSFAQGGVFEYAYDLVIGADVAAQMGYKVGSQITLSHGVGKVSFSHHHDFPFTVIGILARSGTPVDRSLYVHLNALENIHKPSAPQSLSRSSSFKQADENAHDHHDEAHVDTAEHEHKHDRDDRQNNVIDLSARNKTRFDQLDKPTQISSLMLGLNSRIAVLTLQRDINQYKAQALSAIIPGVALAELWKLLGSVESVLLLVTSLMLISSLFGLATMMLATMRERYSEFQVLRIVGAKPRFIFALIQLEVLALVALSQIISLFLVTALLWLGSDWLTSEFSISIDYWILSSNLLMLIVLINSVAFMLGLLPAIKAYRHSSAS